MTTTHMAAAALVGEYVRYAELHGEATERGDDRTANEQHDKLVDAFHRIELLGEPGWAALRKLLGHEDPSVRSWAATHMLKVEPKLASEVLEQISRLPSLTGFAAKMVLIEWKNGTLKLA